MVLNPIKRIIYQVHLLELENYSLLRFLGLWHEHVQGPKEKLRNPITWTLKLRVVFGLAVVLFVIDMVGFAIALVSYGILSPVIAIFTTLILSVPIVALFAFVYLGVAVILLLPIDWYLKRGIVAGAKVKMSQRTKPITVIGITGSYGKTSMKVALERVLGGSFEVRATPDSINTPIGISRFIKDTVDDDIDILIIEMGAYVKGDIAKLTDIVKPDIAILTGINEAHLERFGGLANTIATKFEIVDGADKNAFVLVNADDIDVTENVDAHLNTRRVGYYSAEGNELANIRAEKILIDTKRPGLNFILSDDNGRIGEFELPHLGRYVVGIVSASIIIGRHLGMKDDAIVKGIQGLKPVEHRLELASKKGDIFIIDDSYNGNPDGVREAIETLGAFTHRRRIFVTPGMVEMGSRSDEVHRTIGEELASSADKVVLIKNSVTPYIAEGLATQGYPKENIIWFDSGPKMHSVLPNTLKAGDVVLFQNDWPENYT